MCTGAAWIPNPTPPQVWYHLKLQQIQGDKMLIVLFPGRAWVPNFGGCSPPAAPSPLQKGTRVRVSCCGAEGLWGGLEVPFATLQPAGLLERGWFGRGVAVLSLVPYSQAETLSVVREPLVPRQLLENLPISSWAVCSQHRYLTFGFLSFLVPLWCLSWLWWSQF